MSLLSATWLEDQGRVVVGQCLVEECGETRRYVDGSVLATWLAHHEAGHRPHLRRQRHVQPTTAADIRADIRADRAMRRRIYNETIGDFT